MPDHDSSLPSPPSSADPLAGKLIEGRWRLLEKLGEGGMGAVYLAEQLSIRGRRVAVKLLRAELAQNDEFVRRFRGEAERATAVSDPRIVTVLDFGQAASGELFLVMEYVAGDTLSAVMRAGPLPVARAVSLGAQLADALHRVHEAGIVHRDVKPDNVMVLRDSDDLKLMDFGIARDVDDLEKTHLTQTGIIVGTPAFMAPEQITGGAISRQTDIYAWGVVVYTMLAGRRPFTATSASAMQYMHVHEIPPPLHQVQPGVPQALERAVMRALEKKPENRQRTMAEVATALRAVPVSAPAEPVPRSERVAGSVGGGAAASGDQPPASPAGTPVVDEPQPRAPAAPVAEPTLEPTPEGTQGRPRRGALAIATLAVLILAGAVAFWAGPLRQAWSPEGREVDVRPSAADPTGEEPARREGVPDRAATQEAAPGAAEKEALTLAQFFLDRGEYGSAIEELERAQRAAPDSTELARALDRAREARAAEEKLGATD